MRSRDCLKKLLQYCRAQSLHQITTKKTAFGRQGEIVHVEMVTILCSWTADRLTLQDDWLVAACAA
jgi:hypothetical protein